MLGSQPQQRFAPFRLLQVEHEAALAAVEVQVEVPHAAVLHRRHVAHVVAFVRLDLDDVGAELGEDLGRERTHHDGGEVEDPSPRTRDLACCVACYSGWMPASRTSLPQ